MSDTVIRVENLGKKYILGHQQEGNSRYVALRDVITDRARSLGHRLRNPGKPMGRSSQEEFWALKGVSFEVKQGEVVGIIGRNGAGKSTLLKILSRITEPTEGRIKLRGRVASLLEVGTGFHPELTGRENIFLNGAILGMSRAEINRKFDEIVEFAEVSRFLDTPVKRYSSGMYVRLAFAVAAHLEPEILVVDEVLAVGDAAFQKKCLGKMGDVAKNEGRTILFVSHHMLTIQALCSKGLLIQEGKVGFNGTAKNAINQYLSSFADEKSRDLSQRKDRQGNGDIKIARIEVKDDCGNKEEPFKIGSKLEFQITYTAKYTIKYPRVTLGIYDAMGMGCARFDTRVTADLPNSINKSGKITCLTESINLKPGRYYINAAFFRQEIMEDYLIRAAFFDISESDYFKTGIMFMDFEKEVLRVLLRHRWKVS